MQTSAAFLQRSLASFPLQIGYRSVSSISFANCKEYSKLPKYQASIAEFLLYFQSFPASSFSINALKVSQVPDVRKQVFGVLFTAKHGLRISQDFKLPLRNSSFSGCYFKALCAEPLIRPQSLCHLPTFFDGSCIPRS